MCSIRPWDLSRSWHEGIVYTRRSIHCRSMGEIYSSPSATHRKRRFGGGCVIVRRDGSRSAELELLAIKGWAT